MAAHNPWGALRKNLKWKVVHISVETGGLQTN